MILNSIIVVIIILLLVGISIYFYYYNIKAQYKQLPSNSYTNNNLDVINKTTSNKNIQSTDENTSLSISSILSDSVHPDVKPHNIEKSEHAWDSQFGLPLMSRNEKDKYISKVKNNYRRYEKSLGQFMNYQMDNDTIIKKDCTVNPKEFWTQYKGDTISNIYDRQVTDKRFHNGKKVQKK
jgi:hypothetical protein